MASEPTSSASLKMSVSTSNGTGPAGGGGGGVGGAVGVGVGVGVAAAGASATSAPTALSCLLDAVAVRAPVGPAAPAEPSSSAPERLPDPASASSLMPLGAAHVAVLPGAEPAYAATSRSPATVVVTDG